jgi:hypothetical protein
LIIDGTRHRVSPTTYANLFRDSQGISQVISLDYIPPGGRLSKDAFLARAENDSDVYFINNGVKRLVADSVAMDRYYFDWDKVVTLPQETLDTFESGNLLY